MPEESGKEKRPARKAGTRGVSRQVREERILEVAGHVFAERGYHDASMDGIAERAGVSKPLLYAYFDSKEGLYSAYFERLVRELREDMRAAASADAGAGESLGAGIDAFFGFVERRRHGWPILFSEVAARGPLAEEVIAFRNQVVEEVRRFLEVNRDGAHDGSSPPLAFDALAYAVVGVGESLANWWLWHPEVQRRVVTDWLLGFARGGLPQATDSHLGLFERRYLHPAAVSEAGR